MPASGTATYRGDASIAHVVEGGGAGTSGGIAELEVDFTGSGVSGVLFDNGGGDRIVLVDGRVRGTGFQGGIIASSTDFGGLTGRADCTLYGVAATEAGGSFEGTYTTVRGPSVLSGVFCAGPPP